MDTKLKKKWRRQYYPVLTINDIQLDKKDFVKYHPFQFMLGLDETRDYSVSRIPHTNFVLKKYKISEKEYDEICDSIEFPYKKPLIPICDQDAFCIEHHTTYWR